MAESGAWSILFALASEGGIEVSGSKLQELTGLNPSEINGAVALLELAGYVESLRYLETAPFDFGHVILTSRGRYKYERLTETNTLSRTTEAEIVRSPTPVGSPYGFNAEDWEIVAEVKGKSDQLQVVFGYQFESYHYNTKTLKQNVEKMFQKAVEAYNKLPNAIAVELNFKPLAAGYGGHLFNAIAHAIISADIAVFDTSDLNSNVMIELGVALTWGVRVLPIKEEKCPSPPSDISGQTWADYRNSGSEFVDPYHGDKLSEMVAREARKKGRTL